MKSIYQFILASALLLAPVSNIDAKDIKTRADDSRITWVGRTLKNNGEVSFDWSATYARISFEGEELAIKASDTRKDYFNVWIDRPMSAEPDKVITIEGKEKTIVLADKSDFKALYGRKGPDTHTVIIQKRTEGEQGTATIKQVITDGELCQAEGLKPRMIEFIGDSYTCGFGSENSVSADPFRPEDENCSKTYASILSRYFDADYITVSHSGNGIIRNYDGAQTPTIPVRYSNTFDMSEDVRWVANTSGFKPAISIIYLGTNDFSTELQPSYKAFSAAYLQLIKKIKDNYGANHPVLCIAPKHDANQLNYIREIVNGCEMNNVHFCSFFQGVHQDNDNELGACWHPNYTAHVKLAYALVPYISTITNWPIENKVIE